MIQVNSWTTHLVENKKLPKKFEKYDCTYTSSNKFDDRSDWTYEFVKNLSKQVIPLLYRPVDVDLIIADKKYGIRYLDKYKVPKGKVLVDATSLALPEILHIFHILKINRRSFDVMYVQPTGYAEKKSAGLDRIKTYDLSDDGLGIQQVPPYVGPSDNSMLFYFLGFEGHRFGSIINSDEFDTRNVTCLIGTPPFKLGWENRTLSNNYKQLAEINSSSNARFKFAGANDPIETYELIEQVYKAAAYERQTVCLAPFGTKPAAIAAAQFAVNNSKVVMLYDYVLKKPKRSTGTELVHKLSFDFV